MSISSLMISVALQAEANSPVAGETSTSIDLTVWKYVIIIGLSAITILYIVKRVSEIVVKKKTETMIREVVGEEASRGEDWEDFDKLDKELDVKDRDN